MSHGINANIVHGRRKLSRQANGTSAAETSAVVVAIAATFVPIAIPPPAVRCSAAAIRIDLKRGGTTVRVTWPTEAASDCAAWLREMLR